LKTWSCVTCTREGSSPQPHSVLLTAGMEREHGQIEGIKVSKLSSSNSYSCTQVHTRIQIHTCIQLHTCIQVRTCIQVYTCIQLHTGLDRRPLTNESSMIAALHGQIAQHITGTAGVGEGPPGPRLRRQHTLFLLPPPSLLQRQHGQRHVTKRPDTLPGRCIKSCKWPGTCLTHDIGHPGGQIKDRNKVS